MKYNPPTLFCSERLAKQGRDETRLRAVEIQILQLTFRKDEFLKSQPHPARVHACTGIKSYREQVAGRKFAEPSLRAGWLTIYSQADIHEFGHAIGLGP